MKASPAWPWVGLDELIVDDIDAVREEATLPFDRQ